jgi:hypothetical protein
MKPAVRRKIALLVVCLLFASGCEPKDRRPGTWLSGEVVTDPVTDWSFANEHEEILIETRPWYGIPFSVTVVIASKDGKVFVPSIYEAPAEFPGSKYWNSVIAQNPAVRVKIGGKIYAMQARPAADQQEFEEGITALAEKYDFWRDVKTTNRLPYAIIRLHPAEG